MQRAPVLLAAFILLAAPFAVAVPLACAAPGNIGAECRTGGVCDAGLTCVDLNAGAAVSTRCTRTCTSADVVGTTDCPSPTSCVNVPGVGAYCVDLAGEGATPGRATDLVRCSSNADCRSAGGYCVAGTCTNAAPERRIDEHSAPPPPRVTSVDLAVTIGTFASAADIPAYVAALYRYGLGVGVTLAMVMVVVAGFQYVLARGNPSAIGAAKSRIMNAVIGLLLLLGSYTLLRTVNPDLVTMRNIVVPAQERSVNPRF